jgi:hypothetical protein
VINPNKKTVLTRTNSGLKLGSLTFDGKEAVLTDERGNEVRARATSGLKSNHKANPERRDYTKPEHQWLADKGPLPESSNLPGGAYTIKKNTVQHPDTDGQGVLRYPTGGSARRWGPLRAPLFPTHVKNRKEFFLHLDVNNDGTAGCIGIDKHFEGRFNQIMSLIAHMPNEELPVIVKYK